MAGGNDIARFWADLVSYGIQGTPFHTARDALSELTDEDLAYSPIPEVGLDWQDDWRWPCVQTPRRILGHMVVAATQYANGLIGEDRDQWSRRATEARVGAAAGSARDLRALLDGTLARLCNCTGSLTDAGLNDTARQTWDGTLTKGHVVIEGAILHTAWHLGQVAMLTDWHRAEGLGHALAPPSGPPGAFDRPRGRGWEYDQLRTRRAALLRLARGAYQDSPAHALRMVCEGMTEPELAWRPFPDIGNPWFCRAMWTLVLHTWSPKIVYIDHAFGERKLDYGPSSDAIGGCGWGETRPEKQLAALDRAQRWLNDHVSRASDGDLDRVNPMHINHPMTGWQVVVSMAQHDVWHAGQLSVMRDVYATLWSMRSP